jgi:DNA (cytosine-5)-methyltransferase 1
LNVVSLFTGAGGLDLGLEAAGFRTRVAVEFDACAAETLRLNTMWPVIERDIHSVPSEELLRTSGLDAGETDLLVGGPPCQPFSKSAYWATGDSKRLDDPRASTLEQYLRVLRDLRPKAFLLENVPGLGYRGKSEGLALLRTVVDAVNRDAGTEYRIVAKVLNAADYGVPQERERLFVIGHREGMVFEFPGPTHLRLENGSPELPLRDLLPAVTAWDAIGDLRAQGDEPELEIGGKWADLLPSIPEGMNYLYHTDRGEGLPLFGWRRRFWNFLLKLAKDRPSWTITAQPGSATGPFHWENRRLSRRELCRLQTFPDRYHITGSLRSAQRQLGNAVPSALAEALGRSMAQQFFGAEFDRPPVLVPPYRRPVPDATPPHPVPEKFMRFAGEHSPHPGTGQGFAAQVRANA